MLVSVDALRADRIGAYGYAQARTPAIDGLAADGVLFERAYAHVPQTLPAHAAILTGRLPFESGVRDSAGDTLPASARTLAEILRDRGYSTGAVVSSWLLRPGTGIERGFTFFDLAVSEAPDADQMDALFRDGAEAERVAERWLDALDGPRAFLWLHLAEPHAPHVPPERFSALSPYDGEVAYADEAVGRLMRYLKAHQLYDRTTILLVSDHGESLGEHGERAHGLLAYDGVLRVPLIAKLPGGQGSGSRVTDPVQQIDIVPTVLDLAKAPGAGTLRGRSLMPLVDGRRMPQSPIYAESLFGAFRFGWPGARVLIEGPLKLVVEGSREELFDLAVDPGETQNLAHDRPDVVAAMRAKLADMAPGTGAMRSAALNEQDRERLDALGYVTVPDLPAGEADRPDDGVTWVEQLREAAALSAARNWRGAAQAYRELAHSRPDVAELWLRAGTASARAERYEQAIDAYTHVQALAPSHLRGRLDAAAALIKLRRIDAAHEQLIAVIDRVEATGSERAEAHELQARIALLTRDYDAARKSAERAEDADPDRPVRAFVEGRIALLQSRPAEAAVAFDTALAAAARTRRLPLADLRVFAADALTRLDRHDEAEALLESELRAFPDSARARAALQAIHATTARPSDRSGVAQH